MTDRPKTLRERFPDMLARTEVAVPRGWAPLVARMLERIDALPPENRYPVLFVQIKEKMGELRVNYYGRRPAVAAIVDEATKESRRTCDRCGAPGSVWCLAGTWATLCDTHTREEDV